MRFRVIFKILHENEGILQQDLSQWVLKILITFESALKIPDPILFDYEILGK